ncbi:MAG TPA: YebC/PmpR family DNA-binding transcriptional regulator [Candidatus Paceibacterota bacterium]|nr:YebC/PmpR family DNA-binding transcriptional regulator [Candidatus Paceibacterota bacterium]
MSGHNKWTNIKNRKEAMDSKKGKAFSKMAKIIEIAARKSGDPVTNPSLRVAIDKARSYNMPNDNIERAIKKGTGESKEGRLEEVTYEAYGPHGAALILEVITDNRNRTVSELKHILSIHGGKLAETGSVKYLFDKQGAEWIPKYSLDITDPKTKEQIEKLLEALDDNDDVNEIYFNVNL